MADLYRSEQIGTRVRILHKWRLNELERDFPASSEAKMFLLRRQDERISGTGTDGRMDLRNIVVSRDRDGCVKSFASWWFGGHLVFSFPPERQPFLLKGEIQIFVRKTRRLNERSREFRPLNPDPASTFLSRFQLFDENSSFLSLVFHIYILVSQIIYWISDNYSFVLQIKLYINCPSDYRHILIGTI